jgi:hypothetical protein
MLECSRLFLCLLGEVMYSKPVESSDDLSIFVATPISSLLDEHQIMKGHQRQLIETILSDLRQEFRCPIYCSLERLGWQISSESALKSIDLDFFALQKSHLFLGFLNQSYGAYLETGWASAMGKPLILIDSDFHPSVSSLHRVTSVRYVSFASEGVFPTLDEWKNLFPQLIETIKETKKMVFSPGGC